MPKSEDIRNFFSKDPFNCNIEESINNYHYRIIKLFVRQAVILGKDCNFIEQMNLEEIIKACQFQPGEPASFFDLLEHFSNEIQKKWNDFIDYFVPLPDEDKNLLKNFPPSKQYFENKKKEIVSQQKRNFFSTIEIDNTKYQKVTQNRFSFLARLAPDFTLTLTPTTNISYKIFYQNNESNEESFISCLKNNK